MTFSLFLTSDTKFAIASIRSRTVPAAAKPFGALRQFSDGYTGWSQPLQAERIGWMDLRAARSFENRNEQVRKGLSDVNTRFAKRLRSLREAAMLTHAELGERCAMSPRQIQGYETATVEADLDALTALAQGLELTLQELMFDV